MKQPIIYTGNVCPIEKEPEDSAVCYVTLEAYRTLEAKYQELQARGSR